MNLWYFNKDLDKWVILQTDVNLFSLPKDLEYREDFKLLPFDQKPY